MKKTTFPWHLPTTCPHCDAPALVRKTEVNDEQLTILWRILCMTCPFESVINGEDVQNLLTLWGEDGLKRVLEDAHRDWLERRIRGRHPLQALGDMAE